MPAFYAHDRFGEKAAGKLEEELRQIVMKYYPQFEIGLQGPDIFFFYRPYFKNKVTRYGSHLHNISARSFFEHAPEVVKKYGRDSAEYAYLLGFICHFTLDSECHPYVEKMIQKTGVQHKVSFYECSNEGLFRRYTESVKIAVSLMERFDESLRTGEKLSERFDRTFE